MNSQWHGYWSKKTGLNMYKFEKRTSGKQGLYKGSALCSFDNQNHLIDIEAETNCQR